MNRIAKLQPARRNRQGLVLVTVIICLIVATAMIINLVQSTLSLSRQTTHQAQRLQLQVLTDDALSYAINQYQKEAAYAGETWEIPAEKWMLSDRGEVKIQIDKNNAGKKTLIISAAILANEQVLGDEQILQKLTKTVVLK